MCTSLKISDLMVASAGQISESGGRNHIALIRWPDRCKQTVARPNSSLKGSKVVKLWVLSTAVR